MSLKPEILVVKPIYEPTLAGLERDFTVRRLWTEADPAAYMRQACGNVRAAGFDLSVCYHGPRRKEGAAYPYFDELESMAREVDCLVVTCPLTPATRNLVDARVLRALGPESFLVNVARGAVVDEEALIAALAGNQIAGAALDVFRDEPNVPAELLKMDNVVLAPHIGTSTLEVREGRSEKLLTNLRAFFSGKPLIHKVN